MEILFTNPETAPLALNRRESLMQYLTTPQAKPGARTRAEYDAMGTAEKSEWDMLRIDHLSAGITLKTPGALECQKSLAGAFAENRARNSGHAGVLLTGDSTLGKTTTAKALMRWVVDRYTAQFPEWEHAGHIPVVYVEVPAAANGKTLMREFANFLGLHVLTRESMGEIRTKVVHALRRANTQLIVVDELQNLAGRSAGLGEAADILKGLSNDLTACFLYAGIDLTRSDLMNGARGQQVAGRFASIELTRFEWGNKDHRTKWRALIKAFERELHLLDHPQGSLTELSEYLHQRTSGGIGALSRLLTGCAINLIRTSATEALTQEVLEGYRLDHASETAYKQHLVRTKRTITKPEASAVAALVTPNHVEVAHV